MSSPVSAYGVVLQANKKLVSFLGMVFFFLSVNAARRACLNVCTKRSAIQLVTG